MENGINLERRKGVPEWYAGKNILITGATGFMGKVLVEKLLRDCPEINKIYLLIRPKKGLEPEQRKDEYFNCVIFDQVKERSLKDLGKIKVVKGDVSKDGLEICENDINELISKIEVIFHCAANVRFDQPLKQAVNMNAAGTLRLLKLAEKMVNLKAFVYVSTAYSHCNEDVLEEREYPAPHDPMAIIQIAKTLDESVIDKITPQLLNGLPNTYAYTKALTEGLITNFATSVPIVVCRPSIVTAARKEPMPGWVEGMNGPTGLMVGAGRGVIRSMHCNPDYPADVIPVDTAINAIIVSGWDRGQTHSKEALFYNVVLSHKKLFTWGESLETGRRIFQSNPLCFSLWYPDGSIKRNYYVHMLCVIFFHYLPAYLIDFLLLIFGQKPFLVKIQNRISVGLKVLQYYTTKIWVFENEKFSNLKYKLSRRDQDIFDITVDQINWDDYIHDYIVGIRTYLLKEPIETLPKAKKLLRRLYILDRLLTYIFFVIVLLIIWNYSDCFIDKITKIFVRR